MRLWRSATAVGVNCEADAAAVEKLKEGVEVKFMLELGGADAFEDVDAARVWETRMGGCMEDSHVDIFARDLDDLDFSLFVVFIKF